ncbi:MFS transporter [Winogradskya consettensis]|uniref:MFS transporter n=1 Tax=Winogradskya consettensis TaxID=113560 RepID=UPI001BB42EA7|nr:MFS transporter [Actinoplanes consettensis]
MTSTITRTAPPHDPPPPRSPWRGNHDFRALWTGDAVSQVGSQITGVVLPLLVLTTMNGSGTDIGLLQACYTAPFVLLPLLAGVWLERRARLPVLVSTDLIRLVLVLAVPLLALTGALDLWHVFLVAALGGAATVLHDIAASAYLPRVVAADQLPAANSMLATNQAVGNTAGPGVAGWAAGAFGPAGALVFDALSYLVSASALLLVRRREEPPAPEPRASVRRQITDGLGAVLGQPVIRRVVIHAGIYNAGYALLGVAFLIHFVRELGQGSTRYGLVMVVGGLGAATGALLTPAVLRRFGFGRTFTLVLPFSTLSYLLLPGAGGGTAGLVRCAVAFFLGSAGAAGGSVIAMTLRQRLTPDRLLARMTASYRLIAFGSLSVGSTAAGLLVDRFGARAVLWCAPLVLVGSAVPVLTRTVRRLDRLSQ